MKRAAMLLLPLVVLAGCTSTPIFRLSPVEPDTRWLAGQQVVQRDSGGVKTVISFERTLGRYLIFDVVVRNQSGATILVDPEAFQYTFEGTVRGKRHVVDVPVSAVSPEAAIADLDRAFGVVESDYQAYSTLESVGNVLSAVTELGTTDSKGDHERHGEKHDEDEAEIASLRADVAHDRALSSLFDLRNYWASRALRITHLRPGQSVGGKLALETGSLARLTEPEYPGTADIRADPKPDPARVTLTLLCPAATGAAPIEFRVTRL